MRTPDRWPGTVKVAAAVAAGLADFCAELEELADGVVGPSQWEQGVTIPNIAGPGSNWFLDAFQTKFGHAPNYIAAGSFAAGLVSSECIQRCSSLDSEKLRDMASNLDCNTFYGRFRIDSRTGIQTGHGCLALTLARKQKDSLGVVTSVLTQKSSAVAGAEDHWFTRLELAPDSSGVFGSLLV